LFRLALIQNGILLSVAILIGMILSERIGLRMPLIRAWANAERPVNVMAVVLPGILVGAAVGIVLVTIEVLFFLKHLPAAILPLFDISLWKRLLASVLYGGITEELFMRLFLVSLVAWVLGKWSIRSPKAFLTTVLRNLCLNHLQSARVRREQCLEPSAEQLADSRLYDPERAEFRSETLAIALRILVERLPPRERLVLLLREVFEFEYEEIGAIIRKNSTNCRQMFRRAKQHLTSESTRFTASPEDLESLARQFKRTSTNGDLESLISLLSYA
jgi:RNA polymerase sigma factor (sigma-70 family)